MGLVEARDRSCYSELQPNQGDAIFREKQLLIDHPDVSELNKGAGAGIVEAMDFRGPASRVCGVDLDAQVTEYPYFDEGVVADTEEIPYLDETFDLVFADNVMGAHSRA